MKKLFLTFLFALSTLPIGSSTFGFGGLSLEKKYFFSNAAIFSSKGYSEKVGGVPKTDLCFSKYIKVDGSISGNTISGEVVVDRGAIMLMIFSGKIKFDDQKWCDAFAKRYAMLKAKEHKIEKIKAAFDIKTGKKLKIK